MSAVGLWVSDLFRSFLWSSDLQSFLSSALQQQQQLTTLTGIVFISRGVFIFIITSALLSGSVEINQGRATAVKMHDEEHNTQRRLSLLLFTVIRGHIHLSIRLYDPHPANQLMAMNNSVYRIYLMSQRVVDSREHIEPTHCRFSQCIQLYRSQCHSCTNIHVPIVDEKVSVCIVFILTRKSKVSASTVMRQRRGREHSSN